MYVLQFWVKFDRFLKYILRILRLPQKQTSKHDIYDLYIYIVQYTYM